MWRSSIYNLTLRAEPQGEAYDAENKLASVTMAGHTTSFLYDGDGDRVKATLGACLSADRASPPTTWATTSSGRAAPAR